MKILCISAHPDDIELGMGGTIDKFISLGYDVYICVCYIYDNTRKIETLNSCKLLNISIENIYFNDNILQQRELITFIDKIIINVQPQKIFTHFYGDTHNDHLNTYNAVLSSCRLVKKCDIYCWENTLPGGISHNFYKPQLFIELTEDNIQKKINCFNEHKSQIIKYDNIQEYLINKAKVYGYYCGFKYAETFYIIKQILN